MWCERAKGLWYCVRPHNLTLTFVAVAIPLPPSLP